MASVEMVLPSLEMGGMEQVVCRLARGLQARGWRVGVTCTATLGDLAEGLQQSGVPVRLVRLEGWRTWLGAPEFVAHFREVAPDVVHTHSGVWWRGMVAAARAGVRGRVHTVHGLLQQEPWFGPLEKRLAARFTGATVAVSPSLRQYLMDAAGVPAPRLHLLPNGVDTAIFRPGGGGQVRGTLGLAGSAFVIGIVARLDPVKNIPLVLGPLATLASGGVDAHFVIAGDGPERQRIETAAGAAGVAGRVHFLGTVSDSHLIYPEFDAFVLPSHSEGTSLSLLEAMACGVPCVATSVGGNPAVVDEGAAGILIPAGDEAALAAALGLLAADRAERARLGGAGRARVEQYYSLEAMITRYQDLYATVRGSAR